MKNTFKYYSRAYHLYSKILMTPILHINQPSLAFDDFGNPVEIKILSYLDEYEFILN